MTLENTLLSSPTTEFSAKQQPCIRVLFLTEQANLHAAMQRALEPNQFELGRVYSNDVMEKAISAGECDVAIVDVERRDEWPSSVFRRFDTIAASFPVIILCKDRPQIPHYISKAQHAIDIVAYGTINNPLFHSLVEAAKLRMEVMYRPRQSG